MPCAVLLTNDAARDLEEIYDYIALHDAPQKKVGAFFKDPGDRRHSIKRRVKQWQRSP
jgi:hypothetical protein